MQSDKCQGEETFPVGALPMPMKWIGRQEDKKIETRSSVLNHEIQNSKGNPNINQNYQMAFYFVYLSNMKTLYSIQRIIHWLRKSCITYWSRPSQQAVTGFRSFLIVSTYVVSWCSVGPFCRTCQLKTLSPNGSYSRAVLEHDLLKISLRAYGEIMASFVRRVWHLAFYKAVQKCCMCLMSGLIFWIAWTQKGYLYFVHVLISWKWQNDCCLQSSDYSV